MVLFRENKYLVKRTTRTDINYVADHMRPADITELHLSDGKAPYQGLRESVELSDEVYTILYDMVPFAIFGMSTNKMVKTHACIWMLATIDLKNHKKTFHKISKLYLEHFHTKAFILFNFVSVSNTISIKWLEKLGAKFSQAKPYGKFGTLFKYFELRGD